MVPFDLTRHICKPWLCTAQTTHHQLCRNKSDLRCLGFPRPRWGLFRRNKRTTTWRSRSLNATTLGGPKDTPIFDRALWRCDRLGAQCSLLFLPAAFFGFTVSHLPNADLLVSLFLVAQPAIRPLSLLDLVNVSWLVFRMQPTKGYSLLAGNPRTA